MGNAERRKLIKGEKKKIVKTEMKQLRTFQKYVKMLTMN